MLSVLIAEAVAGWLRLLLRLVPDSTVNVGMEMVRIICRSEVVGAAPVAAGS